MHEILTIQCGNAANYIGTHFWNLQDPTDTEQSTDIDHDVLFSAGQARNGMDTYTPRLLIYDRAKNFGSMKRINALYHEPETPQSDVQVIHQGPRAPEHKFQQSLEDDAVPDGSLLSDANVKFWSDYNTQFYRPESYLPLDSFATSTADLDSFEEGHDVFTVRDQRLDILDADIRPFLEQCDLLQGFNVMTDFSDGWSGFSTALLIELSSEYSKSSKFCFAATRPEDKKEYMNTSLAVLAIHDEVDAIVPLVSGPTWMGAARSGLWLDSLTVPLRSRQSQMHLNMSDLISFLSPQHKLFTATVDGHELGQISGLLESSFTVMRKQSKVQGEGKEKGVLESRMVNSALQTCYRNTSPPVFPSSFPELLQSPGSALLGDSARGSTAYLRRARDMVTGIRGAKGYQERKEMVEEMVELEGQYRDDAFGDSDTSDDDGF